jgi:hypothetical protein
MASLVRQSPATRKSGDTKMPRGWSQNLLEIPSCEPQTTPAARKASNAA